MSDTLEAIYAALPHLACKGLCQECCGPIMQSLAETRAMEKAIGGKIPRLRDNLTCGLLHKGKCSIYANRPLICRLWGVAREMPCPHGCLPERWVEKPEAHTLLQRADNLLTAT